MKKLIVFAAAAALGLTTAKADLCSDDGGSEDSCAIWNVTISLKTLQTATKTTAIKQKDKCSDSCTDCYLLKDVTRKLKGVIWMCYTDCLDKTTVDDQQAHFVLWDTKNKVAVSQPLRWGDGSTAAWFGDTLPFDILDRYTKKATKVEAFWTKQFTGYSYTTAQGAVQVPAFGQLWAAGTKGSVSILKDETVLLKSISGNVVGKINPDSIVSSKCSDSTETGRVLPMCNCVDADDICSGSLAQWVAASGTWSIKYNKSLSKGKKTLASIVPSYATLRPFAGDGVTATAITYDGPLSETIDFEATRVEEITE